MWLVWFQTLGSESRQQLFYPDCVTDFSLYSGCGVDKWHIWKVKIYTITYSIWYTHYVYGGTCVVYYSMYCRYIFFVCIYIYVKYDKNLFCCVLLEQRQITG